MVAANEAKKRNSTADSLHPCKFTSSMLVLFFVLAFLFTWAVLIPALALAPEEYQIALITFAAFGPFVSAMVTIQLHWGWTGVRRWLRQVFTSRISVPVFLAGMIVIPVAIGVSQYGLFRTLGGEHDFSAAVPWYLYLVYLLPTALLGGGNEEPGWRGFALPALLERMHPIGAAVLLGGVHAAWHLPLMGLYDTTFGWFLFNVIPLTFLLNWFYLKSRGSVIPVMLLHAGTNVVGSFFPTPTDVLGGFGTNMFMRGTVYWVIAIVLVISTKGMLGYESPDSQS